MCDQPPNQWFCLLPLYQLQDSGYSTFFRQNLQPACAGCRLCIGGFWLRAQHFNFAIRLPIDIHPVISHL